MVSPQTGRPHSIFFFSNLIIILIEAERKGKKCADIFSLSLSSVWRLWGGYRRYCWQVARLFYITYKPQASQAHSGGKWCWGYRWGRVGKKIGAKCEGLLVSLTGFSKSQREPAHCLTLWPGLLPSPPHSWWRLQGPLGTARWSHQHSRLIMKWEGGINETGPCDYLGSQAVSAMAF